MYRSTGGFIIHYTYIYIYIYILNDMCILFSSFQQTLECFLWFSGKRFSFLLQCLLVSMSYLWIRGNDTFVFLRLSCLNSFNREKETLRLLLRIWMQYKTVNIIFIHSFFLSFILSFFHSFILSFFLSFIHSFFLSFIHSSLIYILICNYSLC